MSAIRIQMASILQNMNAYATLVNYDTQPDPYLSAALRPGEGGRMMRPVKSVSNSA